MDGGEKKHSRRGAGVASFEVELAPGRYGMICFLPDVKDGKAHHEHGMIQEFEVAGKVAAR